MSREVHRMKDADRFRLYEELKTAQPEITRDRLGMTELAQRLGKRLSMTVTKANIKNIAKTLGLKFADSRNGSGPVSSAHQKIDALEVRVEQLERRLSELYRELGK